MVPRKGNAVVVVALWAAASSAGCAGIGEALIGSCLAATLQVGVEVCVDVACGVICDDDDDTPVDDDDHEARPELPPDLDDVTDDSGASAETACRLQVDDGGALRLGCVDGTSAVVLGERTDERSYTADARRTVDGDVVIATADDAAALTGVLAITGSLEVRGPALLRLRLPSLRRVGGDVVIRGNPRLVRAELPALVDVGGAVQVASNPALSADPVPALTHARTVDVVDNDALPVAAVDRLLSIPP